MRFSDLQLIEPLLKALSEEGYSEPTPIQVQAIPCVLGGGDLLAVAQTGTGKTAAFALPIMQRLVANRPPEGRRPVRVLVLTPTRELAAQVGDSFRAYGRHLPLRHTVVYGGVGQQPQAEALRRGVDVLVATPGRLIDLLGQRLARLDGVEILVLDEADRMLDMGFLPAVRRILEELPRRRQTLFFSATMGREPQALADRILHQPKRVEVTPQATTVEKVAQSVHFVEKSDKQALLERLLEDPGITRALVFTRTKRNADRVVRHLQGAGHYASAIHADKSQGQRERALAAFKSGHTRVLVATDIAARGIDVDDISHVVNYDLPNVPEAYVHRIGRTARAGANGAAISFCDVHERPFLRDIEREIRMRVPVASGLGRAAADRRQITVAGAHGIEPTPEPPGAEAPPPVERRPHARPQGRPHGGGQSGERRPAHPRDPQHGGAERGGAPRGASGGGGWGHGPRGADRRGYGGRQDAGGPRTPEADRRVPWGGLDRSRPSHPRHGEPRGPAAHPGPARHPRRGHGRPQG